MMMVMMMMMMLPKNVSLLFIVLEWKTQPVMQVYDDHSTTKYSIAEQTSNLFISYKSGFEQIEISRLQRPNCCCRLLKNIYYKVPYTMK